jgi:hypothetical protein
MNLMRDEFKQIADQNTATSCEFLNEFCQGGWKLAQTSSHLVQKCLNLDAIANDLQKYHVFLMLHNCISDLCCCLDSIERGHDRTVLNNLRMVFEDFCCALHISSSHLVYEKFITNKHSATDSIGPAGKLRPNDAKFKHLYGELSKVSHHKAAELLARQMATRNGPLTHLKSINPSRLHLQIYPLLIIVDFLRSICEVTEELCLHVLPNPYFWIKPGEPNLSTQEDALILCLIEKAKPIFGPES